MVRRLLDDGEMAFAISEVAATKRLVRPSIAADRVAWVDDDNGLHVARREGSAWNVARHERASAGIKLAGDWALWDQGEATNCGCSYHSEGVSLFAAKLGNTLAPELVSDQLWQHCYGSAYAIAIGPDGSPRVAYAVRNRVFHVRRDPSGAWTVEKGPVCEQDTLAFAIDALGRSHVVYRRDDTLCHAVQDGTWKQTKLSDEKYGFAHPSIATDAEGRAHIAFMNTQKSKDQLHYLVVQGNTFTSELVDKKGNAGFGAQIAVGADGVPRIAYRAEHSREWASARRVAEAEHRLASREGGAWKIEPVATGGAAHAFALAGDTLQIAFATTVRGDLSLATRSV